MAEGVDVEGQADVGFGAVEDRLAFCDARVVDEDRGRAEVRADGGSGRGNGGGGCEVAFEEFDGGGRCSWLHALLALAFVLYYLPHAFIPSPRPYPLTRRTLYVPS